MRVSSPVYGTGTGGMCILLLAVFLFGVWNRGFRSITNLLLLVPLVLWGIESGSSSSLLESGIWLTILWGTTVLFLLCWVLAAFDHDISGAA